MNLDINKLTSDLNKKHPDLGINKIEINENSGQSTLYINPKKNLPMLSEHGQAVKDRVERGSTLSRRSIDRSVLDLALGSSVSNANPKDLFRLADTYYKEEGDVGATINLLASLASKGFEHDVDDPQIREFFDVWAYDVDLKTIIENVFLDFFKIGHVTLYKTMEPYESRESTVSPIPGVSIKNTKTKKKTKSNYKAVAEKIFQEVLAKANKFGLDSEKFSNKEVAAKVDVTNKIPTGYTILNPQLVNIEGSLLFDTYSVTLTAPDDLVKLLDKSTGEQTPAEKELLKKLPKDFIKEIKENGSHTLNRELVNQVTYRKQSYERYAIPRTAKIFSSLEYKKALREADMSTLDGISNYILKITVGNDEYPVTSQTELETVAKLFDTPSKSFDVIWNHTLKIEKIVSPEIGDILGKDKYEQVNDDISAGLAISRALLDGQSQMNANQLNVLLKGLTEEINYARRQVSRWLYSEYAHISEVVGFDRFPKIRWDDSILKDTILYMNVIANLVDRRMLSYKTAHETLGFDYSTELSNMEQEFDYVQQGIFGIIGSPFQKSGNVQDTQNMPTGTPSQGRPTGQPAKPKEKDTDVKPSTKSSIDDYTDTIRGMNSKEFESFCAGARGVLDDEKYSEFLNKIKDIRS